MTPTVVEAAAPYRRSSMRRWAVPATATVGEHGLIALSNFALSLVLARWLAPPAFGEFALGLSFVLIAASVHAALVLEPMSVLTASVRHEDGAPSVMDWVAMTGCLGIAGSALLGSAAAIAHAAGAQVIGRALGIAAVMIAPSLLHATGRRMLMIAGRPGPVFRSGMTYAVAAGAAAFAVVRFAAPASILGAVLFAGVALTAGTVSIRVAARAADRRGHTVRVRRTWVDGWRYGRWVLAGNVVTTAATHVQMIMLVWVLGAFSGGVLRAMQIPMMPMVQVIIAMTGLALPALARDLAAGDRGPASAKAKEMTWLLVGLAVVYEVVLVVGHRSIERMLFDGKFAAHAALIPILGLVPVLAAATTGWSVMLRAARRPKHHIVAASVTAPVALCTAALFTTTWGIVGAAWSLVMAYAATAMVAWRLYASWDRTEAPGV